MKKILKLIYKYTILGLMPLYLLPALLTAFAVRASAPPKKEHPRLVCGYTPVINYSYWARAMREAGFVSET